VISEEHAGLLDEIGEHEGRGDGVAAAGLAMAFVLVGLHLCDVIATFDHTNGGAHIVGPEG
jgi:hypothetical protein